jgi:RecA-family ATPase
VDRPVGGQVLIAMLSDNEHADDRPPSPYEMLQEMRRPRNLATASDEIDRTVPEGHAQDELELISVSAWEGKPIPERRWVIRDWIPLHGVTLLAGRGGTGKSLMAQQWASAISVGAEFMGLRSTAPMSSLYVNCEDPADELHRRQDAIAKALGRSLGSFSQRLYLAARMGAENALGTLDERGHFRPSRLFDALRMSCIELGFRVLVLDNAMQLFVGNQNDNGEVTRFLNALSGIALVIDGAVILVAHTAKLDGSEFAGCMAWENAVRSRLYLTRDPDDEAGDVRLLSRNKANASAIGDRLEIEWHAGAFRAVDRGNPDGSEARHEAAFLKCLAEATAARRNVSDKPSAAFAPKIFAGMAGGKQSGQKALGQAMQRLFDKGQIVANFPLWRDPAQRRQVYGIARANCAGAHQTPAQTPAQTLAPNASNQAAQTASQTLPILRIGAGPDGPPPLSEEDYVASLAADVAIAEELGWEAQP